MRPSPIILTAKDSQPVGAGPAIQIARLKKETSACAGRNRCTEPGSSGGSRRPGLCHLGDAEASSQTDTQPNRADFLKTKFVGLTHLFRIEHRRGSLDPNESDSDASVGNKHIQEADCRSIAPRRICSTMSRPTT